MLTKEDLPTKTVMEIKSFAKKNNIDLQGATKKIEILSIIDSWTPQESEQKVDDKEEYNKVAVFSHKNLFWSGLGDLKKGYNIVTREESEKWITHRSVRIATPDEVAAYYGTSK
jgi:hypothetical protein